MDDSSFDALRKRLRELRKLHKLSQERFAELSGIDGKHYQNLEAGRERNPGLVTLEKFAKIYGITVHELLGPEMPMTMLRGSKKAAKKKRK